MTRVSVVLNKIDENGIHLEIWEALAEVAAVTENTE